MNEEEMKKRMKIVVHLELTEGDLNEMHIFSESLTINELKKELIDAMVSELNEISENLDENYIQFEKDLDETDNEMRRRLKKKDINFYERRIINLVIKFNCEIEAIKKHKLTKLACDRGIIPSNKSNTKGLYKFERALRMLIEAEIITFKDRKYFVKER